MNIRYKTPPEHYLKYIIKGKDPVVILQGFSASWTNLKVIADKISLLGHPTYIIPELGNNRLAIELSANIVYRFIKSNKLKNVTIIAHSKGGIVGKYTMVYLDKTNRIKQMISIATPYQGAIIAKLFKSEDARELAPDSATLSKLHEQTKINKKIVSIHAKHDNYIIDNGKSHLEGATNIEINVRGHGKILYKKEVWEIIKKYL